MSSDDALIPWLLSADPGARFRAQAAAVEAAVLRVLRSGHYVLGPEVAAFEAEWAACQGGGHTIGVANGTEALELALRAAGVRPGDRVATVANTVTATVTAIAEIGAVPVFVEIDPVTMVMDVAALAETARRQPLQAVVPVHLYGQPVDLPALLAIADTHGLVVVEDCAQAHGARLAGRPVGTWGVGAAFSFYPTKNLGAIGDAGAVFTRDAAMAARVRELRQYGWRERYVADGPGRNSRLDELQAAILRVYLPGLDAANTRRRDLAARYRAGLDGTKVAWVAAPGPDVTPACHQFVVRTPARESLRQHLEQHRVRAGVLYPVPVHRQPAFAQPALTLPHTERACAEVLSLPIHPELTDAEIDRVIAAVNAWNPPL